MADRGGERGARGLRWQPIAGVALVALVAPLVALPIAGRALADFVAREAGEGLAGALPGPSLEASEPGAEGVPNNTPPDEEGALPHGDRGAVDPLPRSPAGARPSPAEPLEAPSSASRRGLLIRADLVARAVKSGARPSAVPVPASGMRPEGLALYGVGGFGAGLRDGDVVTSIAGAPASSIGAAIGAISGVVRAKARSLSAVVWRGDAKINVTVEIPPITKLGRKDAVRRGP